MSNQPLFQVTNHHGEACGIPPQIDEQTFPGVYRSYFENQNGDQVIFLYDFEQERGTLYMGDAGWDHFRFSILFYHPFPCAREGSCYLEYQKRYTSAGTLVDVGLMNVAMLAAAECNSVYIIEKCSIHAE
jgi:hypothetical protein